MVFACRKNSNWRSLNWTHCFFLILHFPISNSRYRTNKARLINKSEPRAPLVSNIFWVFFSLICFVTLIWQAAIRVEHVVRSNMQSYNPALFEFWGGFVPPFRLACECILFLDDIFIFKLCIRIYKSYLYSIIMVSCVPFFGPSTYTDVWMIFVHRNGITFEAILDSLR